MGDANRGAVQNGPHAAPPALPARLLAEFAGTFALVFAGTGAIAANQLTGGSVGHVAVALTFGLVIGVMVYAYKDLSGAQYNPAVSVALWLRGAFPRREVLPYIVVQLAAAAGASAVVVALFGRSGVTDFGATMPGTAATGAVVGTGVALTAEILTTFLLVTVILGVVRAGDRGNPWAGLAIGGAVALCALSFGPVSGASMNPARSFGPALFVPGALPVYWIYVVGPVVGGVVAVLVDRAVARIGRVSRRER